MPDAVYCYNEIQLLLEAKMQYTGGGSSNNYWKL